MRKLVLFLLSFAAFSTAEAQFANSVLLYGNVGYSNTNNTENEHASSRYRNLVLAPGIGYQFNNHFTLGLAGSLRIGKSKEPGVTMTGTDLVVGPFLRYTKYFSEHLFVFGQFDVNYLTGSEKVETPAATTSSRYNGMMTDIYPALGIHFTKGLAVFISVGGLDYRSYNVDGTSKHTDQFNVTFGQEVKVGVSKNISTHRAKGHREPMDETRVLDTKDDPEDKPAKSKADDDE